MKNTQVKNIIIFQLILIFGTFGAKCQNPNYKPIGQFLADSIHLGEIIKYSLVYKHPASQEVFFTEKSFDYNTFEMVDKIYFPTKTNKGISTDSAIYQFRTFSINPIQHLKVPIIIRINDDNTLVYSNLDSLILIQEIHGEISNLKLKSNQLLLPMKLKVNMIFLFLQIAIILTAIFIWWTIFGKTIQSQFRIFQLYRRHTEYKTVFNRYAKSINKTNIEKALNHWKNYLSKLDNKSFNTMTTPEIILNIPDDNLEAALREFDKSIYGNIVSEKIKEAFAILNQLAEKHYKSLRNTILTAKKSKK